MKVGVTGTRSGITPLQKAALESLLHELAPSELHHSDCTGADYACANLANSCSIRTVAHPGESRGIYRAYHKSTVILLPQNNLERNRLIVRSCDLMIALLAGEGEILRSGTWMTIRYSRKLLRPLIIIYPRGIISRERTAEGGC